MTLRSFPNGFIWGAATAAAQIEGATRADGKGESIWDRFAGAPGHTHAGDTPEVACDHYHRYEGDFQLMRELGLRHYRFSVAWPRVFPAGDGAPNPAGLDFYSRLVDCMLDHGLVPWCTLFHWDLPQALEDRGGWRSPVVVAAFRRYAETVVGRLGDRVTRWITLNEVPAFIGHGYKLGLHAPGARESPAVINQAYHHALLCHGLAVRAVRERGSPGSLVGMAHNPEIPVPVTETAEDTAAAETAFARLHDHLLAPMYHGAYPEAYLRRCGPDAPQFAAGEMSLIATPTDFLGLNVYRGHYVRARPDGSPEFLPLPHDYPRAQTWTPWLNWVPQALYWGVRLAATTYRPSKIIVTENGAGYDDRVDMPVEYPTLHGWPAGQLAPPGEVFDLHRCEYLRLYLQALHQAVTEGYPVGGYFLWTLMDNFEWADGYASRFGLYHTDFSNQRRTPKLSAGWYARVARENRVL